MRQLGDAADAVRMALIDGLGLGFPGKTGFANPRTTRRQHMSIFPSILDCILRRDDSL
jgi:hypothetical protein